MSVNKVILLGVVGKDPETRYYNEKPIVSFSLATTERARTTATGVTIPEQTEWHNIVVWGKNAEWAENYIRKGTRLYLEGKIRTRTWEDRNAIKRYVTEIYADTLEILGRSQSDRRYPRIARTVTIDERKPTTATMAKTANTSRAFRATG